MTSILAFGETVPFGFEAARLEGFNLPAPFHRYEGHTDKYFCKVQSYKKRCSGLVTEAISASHIEKLNTLYLTEITPVSQFTAYQPRWTECDTDNGEAVFLYNSHLSSPVAGGWQTQTVQPPEEAISWVCDFKQDIITVYHKQGANVKRVFKGTLDKFAKAQTEQLKTLNDLKKEYEDRLADYTRRIVDGAKEILAAQYLPKCAFLFDAENEARWIGSAIHEAHVNADREGFNTKKEVE